MYDSTRSTASTAKYRVPTDATCPPRTTTGLVVYLALPVVVMVTAAALTYPGVATGLAGLLVGGVGYHVVRRLVAHWRTTASATDDHTTVVP